MAVLNKDVIIALDFPSGKDTLAFLAAFTNPAYVKVGMELYYAEGQDFLRAIKEQGHQVFLDLKLHDIPHTVERAMAVLGGLGVDMVNVHAAGTKAMMEAAKTGLREGAEKAGQKMPKLIAVTQLTSTDEERLHSDILIEKSMEETVLSYAASAKESGLDGVVCSPWEAPLIHEKVDTDFLTVTPGIRLPDQSADDQSRIATPEKARELTCDYIVVGRAITSAKDPVASYEKIRTDFLG